MKMNQKGRGNDNFQTPYFIFSQLNNIFNFTLDSASSEQNHLCEIYFTDSIYDGLSRPWGEFGTFKGHRVFCNPPFSQKADWIKKADYEVQNNNCPICVMILPSLCMDTKVWHEYIEGKYLYEILQGRISFIDPETGKSKSGNNSGTVIVYFKKKIVTTTP